MINKLSHPEFYAQGARVLMLKSRHKDGVEKQRTILRTSFSGDDFIKEMESLLAIMHPNERIYATAGARDERAAQRLFKERQLQADYDMQPEMFYRSIQNRWISCLMDPKAQQGRLWMFDCDSAEDHAKVVNELKDVYWPLMGDPYMYNTKSGSHIIIKPFDKTTLSERARGLLHDNPLMLWAWS